MPSALVCWLPSSATLRHVLPSALSPYWDLTSALRTAGVLICHSPHESPSLSSRPCTSLISSYLLNSERAPRVVP